MDHIEDFHASTKRDGSIVVTVATTDGAQKTRTFAAGSVHLADIVSGQVSQDQLDAWDNVAPPKASTASQPATAAKKSARKRR